MLEVTGLSVSALESLVLCRGKEGLLLVLLDSVCAAGTCDPVHLVLFRQACAKAACDFHWPELQVTDTKPKRPSWGLMSSSSEGVATAIAAWGHLVIMGDTEGSLNRWDTQTGRISAVQTTQARPHIRAHPPLPSMRAYFPYSCA